jgi:DNA polymerase III subunit gamma/tau
MSQALYRKWRPRAWDEVVSQEHVIQTLRNAVTGDRVVHAYLFSGPRGTGKTTAARLLAKAVNCLNEDRAKRPCNECAHCVAVNENRFLDLIEIDAASNTSVEDVRDLRDKINFSPTQGRFKIYIIDEVHMLSTAAFNALLKTLEEPPPHAMFILATTEIHKIPATVLSRCQRHEFRRMPLGESVKQLALICKKEKIPHHPDALVAIARQSAGGMRDAISLLDQLASTGEKVTVELVQTVLGTATSTTVLGLVDAIQGADPAAGLAAIHTALDAGTDSRALARQVVDYLRSVMLIQMGNGDQVEARRRPRPDEWPRGRIQRSRYPAHDQDLQRRRQRPARRMAARLKSGARACRSTGARAGTGDDSPHASGAPASNYSRAAARLRAGRAQCWRHDAASAAPGPSAGAEGGCRACFRESGRGDTQDYLHSSGEEDRLSTCGPTTAPG